jgi:uncharacterized protein
MTSDREGSRPRAWQRMLSGRRLDLLDPAPGDIAIQDIAHGLARVARWNGQTTGEHAYSVGQHALLVEDIVRERRAQWPQRWLLAALLHDAPEYVVGDLISPFKAAVGLDYKAFERRLLEAIYVRFGLPAQLPDEVAAEIKAADRVAAYYEATRLAGFDAAEAERFFGLPMGSEVGSAGRLADLLEPWPATRVQEAFLERFTALAQAMDERQS